MLLKWSRSFSDALSSAVESGDIGPELISLFFELALSRPKEQEWSLSWTIVICGIPLPVTMQVRHDASMILSLSAFRLISAVRDGDDFATTWGPPRHVVRDAVAAVYDAPRG